MIAWSCSGMQRNPPLVLGLFILTLLLLMGCGSGTSTGAPGPPYVSRLPRRLKRKLELSSAQLRMDTVSTGEGVSQADSLGTDLEQAASLLPSSQPQLLPPATMKREERRADVPLPPPPSSIRRWHSHASSEVHHSIASARKRRASASQQQQQVEREPQPPPPPPAAVSAPPAPPPSLQLQPGLPPSSPPPPPPPPQLQVQSVAIPVSVPEAPSPPQPAPPPALMLSHPLVHPLAQRITSRGGPTPIQVLARPVATLAAAAVPARPLVVPSQGQQLPQQPPVLLIFPQRPETTVQQPVSVVMRPPADSAPPATPAPPPLPPQFQPAHLTGQAPPAGGILDGQFVNTTVTHSTLNPDAASTCVLALQTVLHQIQSQNQVQSSTMSQPQSPAQNTVPTQAPEGEKMGPTPQQPPLPNPQKSSPDGGLQHNLEGPLMLTLSRGAVMPPTGIPSSSVSSNSNILLQIELPMGSPPPGEAANAHSPQAMNNPTQARTMVRLQEAWLKEPQVESKSALRATFPRLNHRDHVDRRLQRQTAAVAAPRNEQETDSPASDVEDSSTIDALPGNFPRGLVSTPGEEDEEHPLRRCSLNPEHRKVRRKTERIFDEPASDAQDPLRQSRDTIKLRLHREVSPLNEGTANVEKRFIPRAKRPRHRIEVPDTFLPLASQLVGLVTTRAAYMINRGHVWPLFKKVETNMDGDSGRERLERMKSVGTNLGVLDISELSGDSGGIVRDVPRDMSSQSPANSSGDADPISRTVSESVSKAHEPSDNFTTKNMKTKASTSLEIWLSPVNPKDFIKLLNAKTGVGAEKPSGSWQLAFIPNTSELRKPTNKVTIKKSTNKKRTTTPGPVSSLESHVREFHMKQIDKHHRAQKHREKIGEFLRMITSANILANVKSVSCEGSPLTTSPTLTYPTHTSVRVIEVTGTTPYWNTHQIVPSNMNMTMSSEYNTSETTGATKAAQKELETTKNFITAETTAQTSRVPSAPTLSTGSTAPSISDTTTQIASDFTGQVSNGATALSTNGSTQAFYEPYAETNFSTTTQVTNVVGSSIQNLPDINAHTTGSPVQDIFISSAPTTYGMTAQAMYETAAPDMYGTTAQPLYDTAQATYDTNSQDTYATAAQTTTYATAAQTTTAATTQVTHQASSAQSTSGATTQVTNITAAQNVTESPSTESTTQMIYGSTKTSNGSTSPTTPGLLASNVPEGAVITSVIMDAASPETTLLPVNTQTFEEPISSEIITSISDSHINGANGEATGVSTTSEIPASTISTRSTFWTTAETIIGSSASESTGGTATLIDSPSPTGVITTETSALLVRSQDISAILSSDTAPATYSTFQISYSTVSQGA